MMMKKTLKNNGQVLIIFAIAVVVLLAFTALAIDGTIVYSQRRTDQSTADSAALAGAGDAAQFLKKAQINNFACNSVMDIGNASIKGAEPSAIDGAIKSAKVDGLDPDKNDVLPTKIWVDTSCNKENGTPYIDVHVKITSSVNTYFLKVISKQPSTSTVNATARVYVNMSFAGGNALVALDSTLCTFDNQDRCTSGSGICTSGGTHVTITGGGAYSAACVNSHSSSSPITSVDGVIQYTTMGNKNNQWISPAPVVAANAITADSVKIKYDDSMKTIQIGSNTKTVKEACDIYSSDSSYRRTPTFDWQPSEITEGYYPNGISPSSGAITLDAGLYCIGSGADVNFITNSVTANDTTFYFMGSGSLNISSYGTVSMDRSSVFLKDGNFKGSNGTYHAVNITIYILKGNFSLENGLYGATMSSPACSTFAECHVPPSLQGVLVYLDPAYSHTFTIANGNGPHALSGTVYAPTSTVTLSGGTSTSTDNMQMIARGFNIEGGAALNMNMGNATLYTQSSLTIQLLK
jgi:Flp pilus assembly protein TadG